MNAADQVSAEMASWLPGVAAGFVLTSLVFFVFLVGWTLGVRYAERDADAEVEFWRDFYLVEDPDDPERAA